MFGKEKERERGLISFQEKRSAYDSVKNREGAFEPSDIY